MMSENLEVTLGPAPCHDCHLPLFYVAGAWLERHWVHHARDGRREVKVGPGRTASLPLGRLTRAYEPHVCPMRQGGNPAVYVVPKGKQGRGGHWRALVGLPRTRRAPRGKPELI